jgi:DNA-binding MarR family transcriptional regulator
MDSETLDAKMRQLDDLFIRMQHVKSGQSVAKKFGLTPTQAFILWYLNRNGQTKASDLAKVAGLSPGAVTQVCDELVRENFVVRSRSSDDRRVVNIDISDEGRNLVSKMELERSKMMRLVFEELSAEEADVYLHVIERVVSFLEKRAES